MVVFLIFFEEQRAAANHDRIVGWDMEETCGGCANNLLTSVIDFFFRL